MITGGTATDRLVDYAKTQASAGGYIADAAQQFSDTADDTNKSISDAVDQLKAAADNTRIAVRNAQTAFQQEQRAWVGLGTYQIESFDSKGPLKLTLPLINTGKTPAIETETAVAYIFSPERLNGPPNHNYTFEISSAIPPQGSSSQTITNTLGPQYFQPVNDGTMWMYFFGEVRYRDIYTKTMHTTSFCLFYDRMSQRMALCLHGNTMN
jgi:ABC-type transporter Mla subunit MlaD